LRAAYQELAGRLDTHGIETVALKGIHLAWTAYPNPALREMADIDILIRAGSLAQVMATFAQLGYRNVGNVTADLAIKTLHETQFVRHGVRFDVHWRLSQIDRPPFVTTEELFARAVPFADRPNTFALAPADALIHICAHAAGATPLEQGIRSLFDVAHITRLWSDHLDWQTVTDRAAAWKCDRSVALTLTLARRHAGAQIPAPLQGWLATHAPPNAIADLAMAQATSLHRAAIPVDVGRLLDTTSPWTKMRAAAAAAYLSNDQLRLLYPWVEQVPLGAIGARVARVFSLLWRYAPVLRRARYKPTDPFAVAVNRRNQIAAWLCGRDARS
jgi:hypothetical protein